MKTTLLILTIYVIGFFTAIPIGAVQVEVAKRSLGGYLKQALLVVAGSVSSDILYGFIAMFGIAPLLGHPKVMAAFWLAGAAVMGASAFQTLRHHGPKEVRKVEAALSDSRIALSLGFSLAVTNPLVLFWWLICSEIVKDLGLVSVFDKTATAVFLLSGAAGFATYLVSLSLFLHHIGKDMTKKAEARINRALGSVLVLLSLYFLFKSLRVFL